jgi:hypothetical protein
MAAHDAWKFRSATRPGRGLLIGSPDEVVDKILRHAEALGGFSRFSFKILKKGPKMAFRVLIIGGTGQVGAAVVRALAAEPSCAEVVMVNRKAISLTADPRLRQVILDTAAAQFPAEVTKLAQSMVAQGDPVYGASVLASVKAA